MKVLSRIINKDLLQEELGNLFKYFLEKEISALDATFICTEYIVSVNAISSEKAFEKIQLDKLR